jgi:hypothetical protein
MLRPADRTEDEDNTGRRAATGCGADQRLPQECQFRRPLIDVRAGVRASASLAIDHPYLTMDSRPRPDRRELMKFLSRPVYRGSAGQRSDVETALAEPRSSIRIIRAIRFTKFPVVRCGASERFTSERPARTKNKENTPTMIRTSNRVSTTDDASVVIWTTTP